MRLDSLRIENFRGLKAIECRFDQAANVIVGPNAIGKTTVLEAVRLAKALLMPRYFQEGQQVLVSLGAMSPHAPLAGYADFASLARDPSMPVRIRLELLVDEREVDLIRAASGELAIQLLRGQLARSDEQSQLALTQYLSSEDGKSRLAATEQDLRTQLDALGAPHRLPIELQINPVSGQISASEPLGPALVTILERRCGPHQALFSYFPADRAFPTGETNIQIGSAEANAQIQSHVGQAPQKYQRLKQTIVNNLLLAGVDQTPLQEDFGLVLQKLLPGKELAGLSVTPVGTLKVSIRESATGKVFDIDSMSSGEKGLILTFMLLRRSVAQGGIALIDEPELHLNPAVCKNIIPFLCETIIADSTTQLIICTHSAEILGSAFERDDCTVHHLRSHSDATRIYERDDHEVFEALRRLGTTAADSLFARGNIFVEGEHDAAILEEGFFDQIAGYRITSLGGRAEVEKEIRTLQRVDSEGELDRLNCFIFDLDRKPASLESTEFVRILQWDRYCLENYLLDLKLLYDELHGRKVPDLGSRGEFEARVAELARGQLTESVGREVYAELQPDDPYMRSSDIERRTYEEIAQAIADRLGSLHESISSFEAEAWKQEFRSRCGARHTELEAEWAADWSKLASGKRLIDDLYREFTINVSKFELKRSIARRMKATESEDWTLVRSKIRDALDT